jgi:hypothetical protein
MNKYLIIFLAFIGTVVNAQELNCKVVINAQQIQTQERRIFDEMATVFTQFMNDRKWTDDDFKLDERINCNLILTLNPNETDPSANRFGASVQILTSRPVYGTDYQTIVMNFADRDWVFEYQPSQPMQFNPNSFISNITSLLAYYAYTIIGMDYDTYSELGGTKYYQQANTIVNNAQNSNYTGWTQFNSVRNRYWLNENTRNAVFEPFRKAMYTYHINGLDIFVEKPDEARANMLKAIMDIQACNKSRPRSIITISFLDAKASEMVQVFSKGAPIERKMAFDILKNIDPARTEEFKAIVN